MTDKKSKNIRGASPFQQKTRKKNTHIATTFFVCHKFTTPNNFHFHALGNDIWLLLFLIYVKWNWKLWHILIVDFLLLRTSAFLLCFFPLMFVRLLALSTFFLLSHLSPLPAFHFTPIISFIHCVSPGPAFNYANFFHTNFINHFIISKLQKTSRFSWKICIKAKLM